MRAITEDTGEIEARGNVHVDSATIPARLSRRNVRIKLETAGRSALELK